jgi:hypothetical protein
MTEVASQNDIGVNRSSRQYTNYRISRINLGRMRHLKKKFNIKSYNALEVAAYIPGDIVRTIATASPTAFFHDAGTWDKDRRVLRVDLKQKILMFLDQPHYTLIERLRPLLSHDRR